MVLFPAIVYAVLILSLVAYPSILLQFAYSQDNNHLSNINRTNNSTLNSDYFTMDKSCTKIPNQYTVTLNDRLMSNPETLNASLKELKKNVTDSGVNVTNVFENIGVLVINSTHSQLLDKVVQGLRNDSRIRSVEQSVCVSAFDRRSE